MPKKWRRRTLRLTALIAIPYVLFCAAIFFFQRHMIYFPTVQAMPVAVQVAKDSGLQPWTTPAGELIGWKKLCPTTGTNAAHGRVLITHGNAGMAVHRADYAEALNRIEPYDVY